jgi:hypothetical protein
MVEEKRSGVVEEGK